VGRLSLQYHRRGSDVEEYERGELMKHPERHFEMWVELWAEEEKKA
jgi:hypothetical protein